MRPEGAAAPGGETVDGAMVVVPIDGPARGGVGVPGAGPVGGAPVDGGTVVVPVDGPARGGVGVPGAGPVDGAMVVVPVDGPASGRVAASDGGPAVGDRAVVPGPDPADGAAVAAVPRNPPRSARTAPVRPTLPTAPDPHPLLLPAFWLVTALLLVGVIRVALILHDALARFPVATLTAMILFTLYAIPFWAFVGALDYLEREPPVLLATAFAWGGLVATTLAASGGTALHDLIAKWFSPGFAAMWGPALVGPSVEEPVKLLGVAAIALLAGSQLNSVLDGVVYGAMVGLGFQVVEDVIYAVDAVAFAGAGDKIDPVVTTFLLRGFLAGLWSHTLFGALVGAGVGYLMVRTDRSRASRIGVAALAFAGAWLCHFVWNSPLLADGLGYGGPGVLAVLLLKGAPALLMILLLVRAVGSREADYYTAQLTALQDQRVITAAELRVLPRGRLRAQARRHAQATAGGRGRRAVLRLQRAQARLAVELSRAGGAPAALEASPAARHWLAEALAQRERLRSLGHPEAVAPPLRGLLLRRTVAGLCGVLAVLLVWMAIRASGAA